MDVSELTKFRMTGDFRDIDCPSRGKNQCAWAGFGFNEA